MDDTEKSMAQEIERLKVGLSNANHQPYLNSIWQPLEGSQQVLLTKELKTPLIL